MVHAMNPNKSHGFDNISIRMIQLCGDNKEHKQIIKNYRPIFLLSMCANLFAKILLKIMYSHLTRNDLITKNHSGFRPGDSTTNQLLFLVDSIYRAFGHKDSREIRAVFLDLSKAFDKVWHSGLIFKLKQNGIDGKLLSLMLSYLMDRKQCIVINVLHLNGDQ